MPHFTPLIKLTSLPSVGSIDGIIVNGDASEQNGESQVCDRIEEIFARKGSTSHGREKCYKAYVHLLAHDYLAADIQAKEDELVAAFLRSVKEETSEKETVLALKGMNSEHTSRGHDSDQSQQG